MDTQKLLNVPLELQAFLPTPRLRRTWCFFSPVAVRAELAGANMLSVTLPRARPGRAAFCASRLAKRPEN